MEKIFVTRPSLPPLEEFTESLQKIWESKWLTNDGEFHEELEKRLCEYLGVKYISLFANGTVALIVALQTLRITGEVITTPFSFVATTHSLWWNGIKPVFCDVDPVHFNLDPERIEAAITHQTTAIMPVHVYGNPCKVDRIAKIADTYGLKIIYDAAHAFGVRMNDRSVCSFGDLSILSFHATKVFNTFEGGAIVCHDESTKRRIDFLKNFGFADEVTVVAPGINGKMNEVQAAFGLLNLKNIEKVIERNNAIDKIYRRELSEVKGLQLIPEMNNVKQNCSYFPALINEHEFGRSRDEVYEELKKDNIFTRKYFYPLISDFPTYKGLSSSSADNLPVAKEVSRKVLCLPIYPDLDHGTVKSIASKIKAMAR